VHVHVNVHNTYNVTNVRSSNTAVTLQNSHSRNDYAAKRPDQSFEKRNDGVKNKQDLSKQPASRPVDKPNADKPQSTGKPVQKDWKPKSQQNGKAPAQKVSVPTQRNNETNTTINLSLPQHQLNLLTSQHNKQQDQLKVRLLLFQKESNKALQ